MVGTCVPCARADALSSAEVASSSIITWVLNAAKWATLARPHSGTRDAESTPSGSADPLECGEQPRRQSLPPGELGVAGGHAGKTAVSAAWRAADAPEPLPSGLIASRSLEKDVRTCEVSVGPRCMLP